MPFLGKQPTAGFASIVKDDLTADGSTTAFTLSKNVASANDIAVFVGNVRQEPTDAYSVSGTTLTMTAAPASGINFYVLHIAGTVESSVVPAAGTSVPGAFDVAGSLTTDGLTSDGDITASNSSGHRNLTVKGNSTTNYQGGSLLLANEGMDTNYGGTYLYHHKAGGTGTDDAGFNISQRTASGGYVSNIWNVDYKNNAHSWYIPNGRQSGGIAMGINPDGVVTKQYQVSFFAGWATTSTAAGFGTVQYAAGFSRVGWNIGSGWDSAGTFTAPVTGKYFIYYAMSLTSGANRIHAGFYINGGGGTTAQGNSNGDPWLQTGMGNEGTSDQDHVLVSKVFNLNANDTLKPVYLVFDNDNNSQIYQNRTYVGGYLLG